MVLAEVNVVPIYSLIGVLMVLVVGCYAATYRWHSETQKTIGRIYEIIHQHTERHGEVYNKGVCDLRHQQISEDLTEIKKTSNDINESMRRLLACQFGGNKKENEG